MKTDKDLEDLLPGYAAGTISEEDGKLVDMWICRSEANRAKAEAVFRAEYLRSKADSIDSADTDSALKSVKKRIRRHQGRSTARVLVYCAAALSIPLMVATGWLSSKLKQSTQAAPVEISCTTGMVSRATLPDGSRVWLNSNSKLSYPAVFGHERRVTLEGEGYFEVAKDHGRKFIVETGSQQVEVTGTEFDIEAYPDSGPEIRTTLISGSIRLHCPDASGREHVFEVSPGEQYIYNRESCKIRRGSAEGNEVTAWTDYQCQYIISKDGKPLVSSGASGQSATASTWNSWCATKNCSQTATPVHSAGSGSKSCLSTSAAPQTFISTLP